MRAASSSSAQTGFTLMEMVISLVVLGLLSVVMLPLLSLPLNAYLDAQRRVELYSQLELIRSKLTTDLQNALPGSLRTRQVGAVTYLEYLEVHAVGRYRSGSGGPGYCLPAGGCGKGDELGTACAQENCLTTLGPMTVTPGAAVTVNVDYVAIVGIQADPYRASPNASLSRLTARATAAPAYEGLKFVPNSFPNASPSKRVYVVSPVTYACDPTNGQLTRYWGYAPKSLQPNTFVGVSSALLANSIGAQCRFATTPDPGGIVGASGSLKQVMSMRLSLTRASVGQTAETIDSLIQIGVREP